MVGLFEIPSFAAPGQAEEMQLFKACEYIYIHHRIFLPLWNFTRGGHGLPEQQQQHHHGLLHHLQYHLSKVSVGWPAPGQQHPLCLIMSNITNEGGFWLPEATMHMVFSSCMLDRAAAAAAHEVTLPAHPPTHPPAKSPHCHHHCNQLLDQPLPAPARHHWAGAAFC